MDKKTAKIECINMWTWIRDNSGKISVNRNYEMKALYMLRVLNRLGGNLGLMNVLFVKYFVLMLLLLIIIVRNAHYL
jgi:hypothetical protein